MKHLKPPKRYDILSVTFLFKDFRLIWQLPNKKLCKMAIFMNTCKNQYVLKSCRSAGVIIFYLKYFSDFTNFIENDLGIS